MEWRLGQRDRVRCQSPSRKPIKTKEAATEKFENTMEQRIQKPGSVGDANGHECLRRAHHALIPSFSNAEAPLDHPNHLQTSNTTPRYLNIYL